MKRVVGLEEEWLSTAELLTRWRDIVAGAGAHCSLRMGDVDAAVAAHDAILTMDFVRQQYVWIDNYYGLRLPDPVARDRLVAALRQAGFLGVLTQPEWYFRPLAEMVISYYGIRPEKRFYAFKNLDVARMPLFYESFRDTAVLLVGGKATRWRGVLERRYGWRGIVGCVYHWNWADLDRAIAAMDTVPYRLALVSAGVAGKILAAHAKETGHVGIDLGSGADACVQADADGAYTWEWPHTPVYNWQTGEHRKARPDGS